MGPICNDGVCFPAYSSSEYFLTLILPSELLIFYNIVIVHIYGIVLSQTEEVNWELTLHQVLY